MKRHGINLVLMLFLYGTIVSNGNRILLLPPIYTSQIMEIMGIGEPLINQGHEVYMALPESFPLFSLFENTEIKIIQFKAKHPDLFMMEKERFTEYLRRTMRKRSMIDTLREDVPEITNFCRNPLEDDSFFESLLTLEFDIAVVDIFPPSRCNLALPYSLGIPYVGINSFFEPWQSRTPALPSFAPSNILSEAFTDKMSFWERLHNTLAQIKWTAFPGVDYLEDGFIKKYIRHKEPIGYYELLSKCSFFLIDADPLIDYPRPTMANEAFVGGLTTGPARELPLEISNFIKSSKGPFIYQSFGSMPFAFEDGLLQEFLKAFRQMDYKIIWKYPEVVNDLPDNVMVMPWLPQNDILGYPKAKIFITHCGTNGQMEALYHGVPMIGFPGCGDQPHNCKRMAAHRFGICLDPTTFHAQNLVDAVNEVLSNTSYETNIQLASAIFKDRPMGPRERAAYWVNHVMKYGGGHIRSHALDMPWYEYLMLDIACFVFSMIVCIVFILIGMIWLVWNCIRPKRPHLKQN